MSPRSGVWCLRFVSKENVHSELVCAGLGPPGAAAHQVVVMPGASGELLAAVRSNRSHTSRREVFPFVHVSKVDRASRSDWGYPHVVWLKVSSARCISSDG